mmetsp:Transcript_53089/g.128862  ORF Transcript_53089/g.128862 Transcript_53089/m.128862 type:complete len:141 (-) Transcript_53089:581-1003(-)
MTHAPSDHDPFLHSKEQAKQNRYFCREKKTVGKIQSEKIALGIRSIDALLDQSRYREKAYSNFGGSRSICDEHPSLSQKCFGKSSSYVAQKRRSTRVLVSVSLRHDVVKQRSILFVNFLYRFWLFATYLITISFNGHPNP